jgi:hypothetical protein
VFLQKVYKAWVNAEWEGSVYLAGCMFHFHLDLDDVSSTGLYLKLRDEFNFGMYKTFVRECIQKFPHDRLERELQIVQLSATRRNCVAIFFWVSLVNFAAITLHVASQRVFIVVFYFVIDSARKLLDTPSYILWYISSEVDEEVKYILIHSKRYQTTNMYKVSIIRTWVSK